MSDSLPVAASTTGAPTVAEFRHKAELPLLVASGILTALVAVLAGYVVFIGETLSTFAQGVLVGLIAPALAFFGIRYMFWTTVSNGVEVTEKQFPELHAMYTTLAQEMGFSKDGVGIQRMPQLYVINGNGVLNAFASKCQLRRGYVVLHSDLVDVAYTHGDFDALRFVLAHELGHIKCGHVDLWRTMITPVTSALFFEPSVTRAQEYTADRVACYYAPEGKLGLIHLYAGKHLGCKVDLDEYFHSVDCHKDGFWLRVANFFSSHAVGFRRMKALRQTDADGWNVHGRML